MKFGISFALKMQIVGICEQEAKGNIGPTGEEKQEGENIA
jgi:hypothetical protein